MKFVKNPTRIIRKKANPKTIEIWAKSQHKRSKVLQNLDELWNSDEPNMRKHKKENTWRIKNEQAYQTRLKDFLITCIYSLQSESHTLTSLWKTCTGQVAEKTVNVKKNSRDW